MPTRSIEVPGLEPFFADDLITDVLGRLKSGKEARCYCCRAHPRIGAALLAAKVYRPLESRRFRSDAIYQEGRVILDARLRRAARKKTRLGRGVQFGMWVGNEFDALRTLHAAGADVPKPIAQAGAAILMEYIGNEDCPAPILRKVRLGRDEAGRLLDVILRNVELFLACDRVHADLSAFNVLYWNGQVKIIDFPQSVDPRLHPNAFPLLLRDVEHVCRYFARQGVEADPVSLADDLWNRFMRAEL